MGADVPDPSRLIPYGRATLRVLGETQGLTIGEMEGSAGSLSPPPAFHNGFDEAIIVVSGRLSWSADTITHARSRVGSRS